MTRVFSTRSILTLCPLFLCSVTSPSIASASAIGTTGSNRDVVVEHFRTFHDGDALQDVDAIVGRMPGEDPVHQEQVYIRPPLPLDSSYHFTPRRTRLTSAYADMASAPNSRFDSQGHYLVVGRQGPVYPRLSIEELQLKQPKQFTLFIIAYLIIQGREVEESAMKSLGLLSFEVPEAASFLALAGVHGLPYERWPGDPDNTPAGVKDHVYNENDPKDTDPIPSRFGGVGLFTAPLYMISLNRLAIVL